MALHTLDGQGNMAWDCHGCGATNSVHISHEAVQHVDEQMVALPVCGCGRQTYLKVTFTPDELAAPNMTDAETGLPSVSQTIARRHITLSRQMRAAGKVPQRNQGG